MKDLTKYIGTYCVYMVQSPDRSLYVGMTNDIIHRLRQHNREIKGGPASTAAKHKHPVKLVYLRPCSSHSDALKIEYLIKTQARDQRIATLKNSCFGITSNFDTGPILKTRPVKVSN